MHTTDRVANKGCLSALNGQGGLALPTFAKTDTDTIPQNTQTLQQTTQEVIKEGRKQGKV